MLVSSIFSTHRNGQQTDILLMHRTLTEPMSGGAPDIEIEEETEAENNQNSNQDTAVPLTSWPTRPPVVPRREAGARPEASNAAPARPRVADIHASYGLHVPTPRSLDHIRVQTAPHSAPLNIIGDFARRATPAMPAMPTPTPTTTSTASTSTSTASTSTSTASTASTASTEPSRTFTRVVNALNTPPQPASQSEHLPTQAFTTDDVEDYFIAQMFENLPAPEPEADSETRTGRSRERSEIRLPRSSSREYDFDLQDAGTYVAQHPNEAKEQAEDIVQHATRALDSPVGQAALLATATWNTSKTVLTAGWRLGSWAVKGMTRYISRAPQVEVLPPEAKLPPSVRFSNANSSTASSSVPAVRTPAQVIETLSQPVRITTNPIAEQALQGIRGDNLPAATTEALPTSSGLLNFERGIALDDHTKHSMILALQDKGIIDLQERLTARGVENSKGIDLSDQDNIYPNMPVIKNPKVIEILTQDGSDIIDWNKYKTQSVNITDGRSVQIHYYKNIKTGKIDYRTYDYKIKGGQQNK